jgi:hypothetical protein
MQEDEDKGQGQGFPNERGIIRSEKGYRDEVFGSLPVVSSS